MHRLRMLAAGVLAAALLGAALLAAPAAAGGAGELAKRRAPSLATRVAKLERQLGALRRLPAQVTALNRRVKKPGTGPAGALGPAGPAGPAGIAGVAGATGDRGPALAGRGGFTRTGTLGATPVLVNGRNSLGDGDYLAFANLVLTNPTGSPVTAVCQMSGGTALFDEARIALAAGDVQTMSLAGGGALGRAGSVVVQCSGGSVTYADNDLIILLIGALS